MTRAEKKVLLDFVMEKRIYALPSGVEEVVGIIADALEEHSCCEAQTWSFTRDPILYENLLRANPEPPDDTEWKDLGHLGRIRVPKQTP